MKSKYSAEEKFQIVMESFSENVTQAEICRRHGIYPVQLSKWREQFIQGGKSDRSVFKPDYFVVFGSLWSSNYHLITIIFKGDTESVLLYNIIIMALNFCDGSGQ